MKTVAGILLSGLIIMIAAVPAAAQQDLPPEMMLAVQMDDEPGFGSGLQGGMTDERREEIRKKIESVRIYRLTEALKLDSQTSVKLAALLGSIDQERVAIMREQREAFRTLREQLAPSQRPDERALRKALDVVEKKHRTMADLREREWNDLKKLLSVEQQARYVLFQRDFMREMRHRMAGARREGRDPSMREPQGPGGMGPEHGRMPR